MPIDTSVPLSTGLNFNVAPPVVDDPQQALAKSLTLQSAMQQRQLNAQSIQEGQLGLQQKRQAISDQQGIQQAFIDANGDAGQLVPLATKHGVSGAGLIGLQKNVTEIQKAAADKDKVTLENQATKNDRVSGALDSLIADPANADPATFAGNLATLKSTLLADKTLSPAEAQNVSIDHLTQVGGGDPMAGAKTYNGYIKLHSGVVKDALSGAQTAEAAGKANESNALADTHNATRDADVSSAQTTADQKAAAYTAQQLGAATNQAQWDAARADAQTRISPEALATIPAAFTPQAAAQARQAGMTADQQVSAGQAATRDANVAANERARTGIAASELGLARQREAFNEKQFGGSLDDNTIRVMANAVHSGVPISQVVRGQGKAATAQATQVLSYIANNIDPQFNVGRALADYAGQKGSVVDLTKQFQSTSSLEKIAGANVDSAMQAFSKLKDSGSPLLNTPMRLLNDKMFGDGDQAQAMTMLLGAARESARVVNNFGGKGELTDSARSGVDALMNNRDMTLNQFMGVARGLKTDFQNVHNGMYSGLQDARNSIGSNNGPTSNGAQSVGGHKIGDTVTYQGKPHKVTGFNNGKLVLDGSN